MQPILWGGTLAALLVAVVSGLGERRRQRRDDPDHVGFMPWTLIQMLALIAAAIMGGVALHIIQ